MKKQKHDSSRMLTGKKRPMTKEEALRQLVEKDPKQAARLIQEILKGK
jgi:flagellar biosynthesis/type III secretory pathway M-ring protein FliF/YscJ